MKAFWTSVSNLWCHTMHRSPMWPVNGKYRCPDCMREFSVPWEEHKAEPAASGGPSRIVEAVRTGVIQ
jgi:hypothetical protein